MLDIIVSEKLINIICENDDNEPDGSYFAPENLIVVNSTDKPLLIHETCHYLSYTDDQLFRELSERIIEDSKDIGSYPGLKELLMDDGYCEDVVDEEMVAYTLQLEDFGSLKNKHTLFKDIIEDNMVLNYEDRMSEKCFIKLCQVFGNELIYEMFISSVEDLIRFDETGFLQH